MKLKDIAKNNGFDKEDFESYINVISPIKFTDSWNKSIEDKDLPQVIEAYKRYLEEREERRKNEPNEDNLRDRSPVDQYSKSKRFFWNLHSFITLVCALTLILQTVGLRRNIFSISDSYSYSTIVYSQLSGIKKGYYIALICCILFLAYILINQKRGYKKERFVVAIIFSVFWALMIWGILDSLVGIMFDRSMMMITFTSYAVTPGILVISHLIHVPSYFPKPLTPHNAHSLSGDVKKNVTSNSVHSDNAVSEEIVDNKTFNTANLLDSTNKSTGIAIYCRECGTKLDPAAIFCPECGTRIISMQPDLKEDESAPTESPSDITRTAKTVAETAVEPAPIRLNTEKLSPTLRRAFILIEDEEWEKADGYLEKVLDEEPENAYAYLGKLLIKHRLSAADQIKDIPDLENNKLFLRAVQYADEELKAALLEINEKGCAKE